MPTKRSKDLANLMNAALKANKGLGMEGLVAKWYAKNAAESMSGFKSDACRVAALLAPDSKALEVALGPGYFAIELARWGGYQITGLDIGKTLVEIAQRNAAQREPREPTAYRLAFNAGR
jgi:2-polyprenyl-3-methyl-5-hydroxy-6-metoxy-1,4-benzoquinol methylase